jgi:hypothetical protein
LAPTQPLGQFSRGWAHALKDTAGRHLFQVHAETGPSVSSASASSVRESSRSFPKTLVR